MGNCPTLGYKWKAQVGTLRGATVITETVMGYVQLKMEFVFSSATEASVKLLECLELDRLNPCLFSVGTTIYLTKVNAGDL